MNDQIPQKVSQEQESENKSNKCHMNHGLMMILGCLLPILFISALPLFGIRGGAGLSFLAFLFCPLMHVGMMFMMGKDHKH